MEAWLLRNLKFPECPVGTTLGHLEVNENDTGTTYFFVAPDGIRTALHIYIPDPTYVDSALLEGNSVAISKSLYLRAPCQKPKASKRLPEDSGEYRQAPIATPARHFEKIPQVNLDALSTSAATSAVLQYLEANPKCSKDALQQRFHCSNQRLLAILENPDLVVRMNVGPMRVYSVKK
jgi:hypothetical protein